MSAAHSEQPAGRFLTIAEVMMQVPFSRTTIWRWAKEGKFPKSIPLGSRKSAWDENEIAAWKEARKGERGPPDS